MLELCLAFHCPPSRLELTDLDEVFMMYAMAKRNELQNAARRA
jgi:hypothetical protein